MSQIKIPKTVEEAQAALDGVGALLQAKNWERAALVYAFTTAQKNQNPLAGNTASGKLSFTDFAAKGIVGLTDRETVADYHKAWLSAIDDGAPDVAPGDTIAVPTLPWPPGKTSRRGSRATKDEVIKGFRKLVEENPKEAIADVIADSPEMAEKFVEGAAEAPGVDWRMEEALRDKRQKQAAKAHTAPTRQTPPREVVEKVIKAIDSFFRTTIVHNGQTLTYEQIIDEVVATGPVPELGAISIRPHWLGEDLAQSLQQMSRTAATKVEALGEPTVAIGAKEIEG